MTRIYIDCFNDAGPWYAGSHFTWNKELVIWTLVKIKSILIQFLVMKSHQNFAHTIIAQLAVMARANV